MSTWRCPHLLLSAVRQSINIASPPRPQQQIYMSYIMLILQYNVSFTYDSLGRCFRFVYIYARVGVFFCVAAVSR